jgi:homogentisate 1,2-dioxygenase
MDSGKPQWTQATPAGYMPGFGNDFETEALPGALPVGQNSPQRAAYGLYAEQLSGSPFTAPRGTNERSWLYRIRPSVQHAQKFKKSSLLFWKTAPCLGEHDRPIGQLRWGPVPVPKEKLPSSRACAPRRRLGRQHASRRGGASIATQSMEGYFYNADGEVAGRAAAGRGARSTPVQQDRGGIRRDLIIPAGSSSRSSSSTARRGATCAGVRRQFHPARPRARQRQLPRQRAT